MIQFPPNPTTQVGGSHYLKLKVQPIVFAIVIGANGPTLNVIKYLSRAPYKNGEEDYEKAIQCLQIMEDYHVVQFLHSRWIEYLDAYCDLNALPAWIYDILYLTFRGEYGLARVRISHRPPTA